MRDSIEVPYLCSEPGEMRHLDATEWKTNDDAPNLPSFQEICFFGTLKEFWNLVAKDVFDLEFPRTEFIRVAENGRPYVTTVLLPRFLCDWMAVESGRSDEMRHHNSLEAFRILKELHSRLCKVQGRRLNLPMEQSEVNNIDLQILLEENIIYDLVILSVTILAETLDHGRKFIYEDYERPRKLQFPRSPLATALLLRAGWCRGEGVHLTSLKAIHAYYCSSFAGRRPHRDHTSCTRDICVADNIKAENYQTKHVSPSCNCQFVAADLDTSSEILYNGQIPIIRLVEQQGTKCKKWDTKSSSNVAVGRNHRYVAISHVWSDGMGNPNANSLPRCQLEKLQLLVDNLYRPKERPVLFWIDTICVPVEPGLRNKAIGLMRRSYQEADKVLVIDKSILNVHLSRYPGEPLWRIFSSPWMKRLWTFQEGMFARSLYFQFGEGAIKIEHEKMSHWVYDSLLIDVQAGEWSQDRSEVVLRRATIWAEQSFTTFLKVKRFPEGYENKFSLGENEMLGQPPANLRGLFFEELLLMDPIISTGSIDLGPIIPFKQLSSQGIEFILNNVQRRTTSKISDEPICIASLLGLDLGFLTKIPTAQRMRAFFLMLKEVPAYIMFSLVPRLPDHGFRWAPTSFLALSKQRINLSIKKALGYPTESGLLVRYPGFVLPRRIYFSRESGISLVDPGGVLYRVAMVGSRIDPEVRSADGYPMGDYAIVLSEMPVRGRRNGVPAVFAAVDELNDQIISCRFCRVVQVEIVSDRQPTDMLQAECTFLPLDQQWRVA